MVIDFDKVKDSFCVAVCNGRPSRSTCLSLGTCKQYDLFIKLCKMGKYVDKYVDRDKKLSRGIRNNNPGNIRCGSTKWLGLSSFQSDPEFCQFDTLEYGIRALLVVLRTYYNKHHCNTIRKVISRYAPSNENNTEKYIEFVSDFLGYLPDVKMSLSLCLLLAVPIMKYESGLSYFPSDLDVIIDKFNLCKSHI